PGDPASPPPGLPSRAGQAGDQGSKSAPPLGEKLHQGGGGETPPPLGEKFPQGGGGKSTPSPRGKNSPTQETVLRQRVERQTETGSTRFDGSTLHINTSTSRTPGLRGSHVYVQSSWERPPADDLVPLPAPPRSPRHAANPPAPPP